MNERSLAAVTPTPLLALLLLLSPSLSSPAADPTFHHLFHPIPDSQLRDLSTDRPDQTESPYTVDPGHLQLELDLANGIVDHHRSQGIDLHTSAWSFAAINLKFGLLPSADLQLLFEPLIESRIHDRVADTVDHTSGPGDFITRLKINLWGNDGGRTAFAVMPFIKWPLPASGLRNGRTEGGVILPIAVDLGAGWGLGAMTELDVVSDDHHGHDLESFNTITLGHDLIGDLAAYLEFAALVAPESDLSWQGQIGLGFTYALNSNTQLDLGCNFGVTSSAPDFNPFSGISVRF